MKVLCVDDEKMILDMTVSLCEDIPEFTRVAGFQNARHALEWLQNNDIDLAILDIDMPEMNGLELAEAIKRTHPDAAIIFQTGYTEYAVNAFSLRASGYLLKPVSQEKLLSEIEYALRDRKKDQFSSPHIFIRTFGEFDLFLDGEPVIFSRSKAKELLAYLVDRQGSTIARADAFAALYEDVFYDRAHQKQFDVIIRSLRATLMENEIDEILDLHRGKLRVVPETFDCDLYSFLDGNVDAVNAYRGEYMSSYSWASITESFMTERLQR